MRLMSPWEWNIIMESLMETDQCLWEFGHPAFASPGFHGYGSTGTHRPATRVPSWGPWLPTHPWMPCPVLRCCGTGVLPCSPVCPINEVLWLTTGPLRCPPRQCSPVVQSIGFSVRGPRRSSQRCHALAVQFTKAASPFHYSVLSSLPPKGWVTSALLATAATTVPSTWRQSRNAAI